MKVAVIGKTGQIASEFINLKGRDNKWTFLGKSDLDITKKNEVQLFFSKEIYNIIINCAGFTDVIEAERKKKEAYTLNEKGVKNLVLACEKYNSKLIHFSTDYVFEGSSKLPYKETDYTFPINTYGKSKEAGEKAILKSNISSLIIRSSWIYSRFGNNFVKKLIALSREKNKLEIINDQRGTPTHARDIVKACMLIIKNTSYKWKNHGEIFHYSNEGECSWYEFAKEIFRLKGINILIVPKTSNEFLSIAQRPKYSVLDKSKIKTTFKMDIPDWKNSLREMINKL